MRVRLILLALWLSAQPVEGATLGDAAGALAENRPGDALSILEQIDPATVGDPIELRFLTGLALLGVGRPDEAADVFEDILNQQPNLTRVRLELARAYFESERYSRSERQFRLVLGGDLPEAVRLNVRAALDEIARRKTWSGGLRFGLAPDTNISARTRDESITLFGREFVLDDEARQRSGFGFEMTAVIRRRFSEVAPGLKPVATGSLALRDYANDEFDDHTGTASVGLEKTFPGGRVQAGPLIARRWFGGEPYATTVGMSGDGHYRLADGLYAFGRTFAGVRSETEAGGDDRVLVGRVAGGLQRALDSQTTLTGFLGLQREVAGEDYDSFFMVPVSIEIAREFPGGFRGAVGGWAAAEFHDADDPLFGRPTDRQIATAAVSVGNREIEVLGFSPTLRFEATKQWSEISLLEYDRLRAVLGVERDF